MPSEMRRLRQLEDENAKRVYRLYKGLGLQLRQKPPRRRVKTKLREGRCAASCSNEVWAMDFVHDQLATGSKLRILTVIDTYSRSRRRFSFRALDVIEVLDRVCGEVGYPAWIRPASIRVDQGSEFVSRDLDLWAYMKSVTLDFSRPGTPTDNAFIESFNGKLRAGEPVSGTWSALAGRNWMTPSRGSRNG